MYSNPHNFRTQVGMDASGPNGEISYYCLINFAGSIDGTLCIWDSDVSSFDISIPRKWIEIALSVLFDCADMVHQFSFKRKQNSPWEEGKVAFFEARMAITKWFFNHEYQLSGLSFNSLGFNPSGTPITTLINNVCNQIIAYSCFFGWLYENFPDDFVSLENDVDKLFFHQTYGDDSRSAISQKMVDLCVGKGIEPYSCQEFIQQCAYKGIKATPGNKDLRFSRYSSMSDLVFLQRRAVIVTIPGCRPEQYSGNNDYFPVMVNRLIPPSMFKMFAKVGGV
jgi:hypothetical protein